MSTFSFRQRVGKLNWKVISSVDVDSVVEETDIVELQSVIDIVTFSEFCPVDVKENTIESVCKLVNIMQLIVEYLLHCQESQYRLLQITHEKNQNLRNKNQHLKKQCAALCEDCKIYQNQCDALRHSLAKANQLIADSGLRADPRIVLGTRKDEKEKTTGNANNIVDTMMQNEKENKLFFKSLLEEQRSELLSQIARLSSTSNRSSSNDSLTIEKMCSHIEKIIGTTMGAIYDNSNKFVAPSASSTSSVATSASLPSTTATTELAAKLSSLEAQHAELKKNYALEKQQWESDKATMLNKLKSVEGSQTSGQDLLSAQLAKQTKVFTLERILKVITQGKDTIIFSSHPK